MDQDELDLEEGELSHDSEGGYTPLERPANYSKSQPLPRLPALVKSESEEEFQSNDSDSDSDPNLRKQKKPKIRLKPKPQQRPVKNKKYNIWSNKLQEENLAATLDNCDVVKKDRSRDVESYDYTLAHRFYSDDNEINRFNRVERKNNKRTREDRKNANFRQRQRSASEESEVKGEPRELFDLRTDKNSAAEDIASDIANKLSEEKEDLILKVIKVLGKERAMAIYNETKDVEAQGGMLIMNKTRRRTPGGVFLNLVRNDYHITLDQRNEIFGEERQRFKKITKEKQKEKSRKTQLQIAAAREKILPDLLTRAELLATQNPDRRIKDKGEQDCVNPPPTPETDGCENSRDGMDGSPLHVINKNDSLGSTREKLTTYDDDFLDIGCHDDMDLF